MSMTSREPYIIAEIGSNLFKGRDAATCLDIGLGQIAAAKGAGADAVKFQMFTVKELYGPSYPGPESKYALPRYWVEVLADKCERTGIDFMCSAFSVDGYEFIDPFVKMHKVASPEALDEDIMNHLGSTCGKPVLVSNGCGDPVVTWGGMIPMECVSKYPASLEDYDLQPRLGPWGVSDHTMYEGAACKGRQMGATYFERHVDFFKGEGLDTPDTPVSYDRISFGVWASGIRGVDLDATHDLSESRKKYGRVEKDGGWYRPWPEGE